MQLQAEIRISSVVNYRKEALCRSFDNIDRQFVLGAQCLYADLCGDLLSDLAQGICHRRVRIRHKNWFAAVATNAHVLVYRDLAEEVRLCGLGQLLTTAGAEDVHAGAIGQIQIGHILHNPGRDPVAERFPAGGNCRRKREHVLRWFHPNRGCLQW